MFGHLLDATLWVAPAPLQAHRNSTDAQSDRKSRSRNEDLRFIATPRPELLDHVRPPFFGGEVAVVDTVTDDVFQRLELAVAVLLVNRFAVPPTDDLEDAIPRRL